jgi:hypothetical protein
MPSEAALTAAFAATAETLKMEYAVANTSPAGLYVIDVSVQVAAGGAAVRHGIPRIELSPERVVLLMMKLRPLDPRRSYTAPPQAYAVLLPPGGVRRISTELSFPLIPANLPPSREVQEILLNRLSLTVGVVPVTAAPAVEQEIGGEKLWRLPATSWKQQRELRFDAAVANLRVLVHK